MQTCLWSEGAVDWSCAHWRRQLISVNAASSQCVPARIFTAFLLLLCKWRRQRSESHSTLLLFNWREDALTHLEKEREVTWEESETKRVASLLLSKQIFLLFHTHHYIRAPCSRPETKWNRYLCFMIYEYVAWSKQFMW